MDFQYGCFLSYRHGEEQMVTLVEKIREALANELDMYLDIKKVFQDKDDIAPGNWVRETISAGMCRSVVMILVYTPKYFSKTRLFCTSELEGMLRLENQRAAAGSFPKNGKPSIVIPVLLRGAVAELPHDLKNRNPVDFTRLSLAAPEVLRDEKNMAEIRRVAKEIADTLSKFEDTDKTFCDDCQNFLILDESNPADQQKIKDFIAKYKAAVWQPEFVIS